MTAKGRDLRDQFRSGIEADVAHGDIGHYGPEPQVEYKQLHCFMPKDQIPVTTQGSLA